MSRGKRVVGIYVPRWSEREIRVVEGVLAYFGEQENFSVRDFRFSNAEFDSDVPPPWRDRVDGVVLGLTRAPGIVKWIESGGVPVVNTKAELSTSRVVSVYADMPSIAQLAAEHLEAIGCRRVVYFGYHPEEVSQQWGDILAEAMERRDLKFQSYESANLYSGKFDEPDSVLTAEKKLASILRRAAKPLGIVAINDDFAVAAVRLAQELGLEIPKEVAVLGGGDWAISRMSDPPISTIRWPSFEIGKEAARLLHRMLDGKRLARRKVQIPAGSVIVRASTVAPQNSATTDVDRAREFIASHATAGVRVKDVAAHVHSTVRTLERNFLAAVGLSVGDEIRRVRLERSKELLSTTDLSITRIAGMIGYNDHAYFTHFFREQTGHTPSEYRNRYRRT